jgi:hypothetical protein
MFHMSNDSGLFRPAHELANDGFTRDGMNWRHFDTCFVPLYEAKMVSYFDNRWGFYSEGVVDDTRALPRPSLQQKQNPNYDISPRFWVEKKKVDELLNSRDWKKSWMIVRRDMTNNTNERTFITSIIPRRGVGNTLPIWIVPENISVERRVCLYVNSTTLVTDFVARNKIGGTHINYFHLKQFPFFTPHFYINSYISFIIPLALELTYTSHALAPFACDLGYDGPPFQWDEERRALLRADLDAFYARAYGLTRDELRYILDPADVMGPDYPSETFRVLKKNEEAQFGEYRTRRLVLEAWDRMEAGGEFKALGL